MPRIFLIPNIITDEFSKKVLPDWAEDIAHLRVFFVEELKAAQKLLKKAAPQVPFDQCQFLVLNEHISFLETEKNFSEIKGQDFGIISEVGMPCIADPGAPVVLLAHKHQYEIVPLVGPGSIFLALAASGLGGQNFAFNGYLPKEENSRLSKIRNLENRAKGEGQTQIFMETPYRNRNLFDDILKTCKADTLLCVALDLTGKEQFVKTQAIKEWQKNPPPLPKKPALFLIGSV